MKKFTKRKRKAVIKAIIKNKEANKIHLEMDLAFLKKSHDSIFKMTEEELRNKKQEIEFKVKNKTANDTEKGDLVIYNRQINKYTSIKTQYGKTEDELGLMNSYLNFLKEEYNA